MKLCVLHVLFDDGPDICSCPTDAISDSLQLHASSLFFCIFSDEVLAYDGFKINDNLVTYSAK